MTPPIITPVTTGLRDDVAVTEAPVIHFPNGILGLPAATRFVLTDIAPDAPPDALFQLLRSVDGGVSLVVTQPWQLFPEYAPDLPDDELEELDVTTSDQITLFNPVTLDAEHNCVYVNLMGPFVVNSETMTAKQIVLADSDWPLRAQVDL